MNTTDYIAEANRQLLNNQFYEKCDRGLTEFHMNKIYKVVTEMYNKQTDEKCKNYSGDPLSRGSLSHGFGLAAVE